MTQPQEPKSQLLPWSVVMIYLVYLIVLIAGLVLMLMYHQVDQIKEAPLFSPRP